MKKIYPDSGVELNPFISRNYDKLMNAASFGLYKSFIKRAIDQLHIQENDSILDMGCGTGRNLLLMNQYTSEQALLLGMDISDEMKKQFQEKTQKFENVRFVHKRIDQTFDLNQQFDKVFISFVIHGFPHEIRKKVIENAYRHLKVGGTFHILDFSEFDMEKMPFHHRFIFKAVECKYAFDFIEKNWKAILAEYGFTHFEEQFFLKHYVRLLSAKKK
jgi:demethylmenaquinone methyltransferase/2-methoxy-6-polyprenyl-1,4-benzoquinol methylase